MQETAEKYELQIFRYHSDEIKVIVHRQSGRTLFDAASVCRVLGYRRDASTVLEKLDDDEKILLRRDQYKITASGSSQNSFLEPQTAVFDSSNFGESEAAPSGRNDNFYPRPQNEVPRPGGAQYKNFVTEPGLYKLIFRSEKHEAKSFTRWITHEVIPSIRRTGSYILLPTDLERIADAFAAAREMAKTAGKRGRKGIRLADEFVNRKYGVSPLKLLDLGPKRRIVPREEVLQRALARGLKSLSTRQRDQIRAEYNLIKWGDAEKNTVKGKFARARRKLSVFQQQGLSWSAGCRKASLYRLPREQRDILKQMWISGTLAENDKDPQGEVIAHGGREDDFPSPFHGKY